LNLETGFHMGVSEVGEAMQVLDFYVPQRAVIPREGGVSSTPWLIG